MLLSTWSFLSAWYNLPFLTLIGLCLVLAAMQLIGLGGGEESGSDHDIDADHSVDLDHSIDVDHSVDVDHTVDLDHDVSLDHDVALDHDVTLEHEVSLEQDASVEHDASLEHDISAEHDLSHDVDHGADTGGGTEHAGLSTLTLLAFVGVGKIPLMVVLLILFAAIGLIGLGLNGLLKSLFGVYPRLLFFAVLPASVIAGSVVSSRLARMIGYALPPVSTTASRSQSLVGRRGTVISPFVDERYGLVHLRDAGGTLINVFATNQTGQPIQRGDTVVLLSYDDQRKYYRVAKVLEQQVTY